MLGKTIGIVFILAAFAVVGHMDKVDAEEQTRDTCEMVSVWLTDRDNGVPAEQRNGWPPETAEKHNECRK